jgi:Lsr2
MHLSASADEGKCTVAQQVSVTLVDDLDGSEAAETVTFGLDGRSYEVDLSAANAAKLRDAIAPFVAAARRAGSGGSGGTRRGRRQPVAQEEARPARSTREQTAAIRQWARDNGHQVSERGRIPKAVMEAYRAAS